MELFAKGGVLRDDSRKNRLWARLVAGIFLLPLFLVLAHFIALKADRWQAEKAAEGELAGPAPKPDAYGVLGAIRLEQGKLDKAIPLLAKAAALEQAQGRDTRDTLCLAKAQIEGAKAGVPGASQDQAETALKTALRMADKLGPSKRAATYFSAGLFWRGLGRKDEAVKALRTAVDLQRDDWVDEGQGRHKSAGLSAYYQRMLASAQAD